MTDKGDEPVIRLQEDTFRALKMVATFFGLSVDELANHYLEADLMASAQDMFTDLNPYFVSLQELQNRVFKTFNVEPSKPVAPA